MLIHPKRNHKQMKLGGRIRREVQVLPGHAGTR